MPSERMSPAVCQTIGFESVGKISLSVNELVESRELRLKSHRGSFRAFRLTERISSAWFVGAGVHGILGQISRRIFVCFLVGWREIRQIHW
jgi:hypothetical protein